jgi:hypothetical protein
MVIDLWRIINIPAYVKLRRIINIHFRRIIDIDLGAS